MNILAVSHLFPNRIHPNRGIFVKERIKHIAAEINLTMVAPIAYFPCNHLLAKYSKSNQIPYHDVIDSIDVHHPRYFLIPRYAKYLDAFFYYHSLNSFFQNIFQKNHFDILDFHWVYPDAYAGLQWAQLYNKKIIVTVRGNEAIYYFEKCHQKKMLQRIFNKFDHVITVSDDLKKKVITNYSAHPENVTVIPNGIDRNKFFSFDKKTAKQMCGLDEKIKYVLLVSRLSPEKGIEYLLRAFAALKDKNTFLVIIGTGPLTDDLSRLTLSLEISNNVCFIESVNHGEINQWYNAADIFCLPSLWEGCPNVIIESLACGTPVVSTTVGGIPDLVPGDEYGILVAPGNVASLTGALCSALQRNWDRDLISRFGASNSWQDTAEKVIKIYQQVLS